MPDIEPHKATWPHRFVRRIPHQLRVEPMVLVLIILCAGALWGFVALADEVVEGDTHQFDRSIVLAMRSADDVSDPIGPGWVEEMMRDFTALGGIAFTLLACATAVVYLALEKRWALAFLVFSAVIGGFLLSMALKYGFDRPRPDLVPHGSIVYTRSFPSGHSMTAAITFLTLGTMLARIQRTRAMRWFILCLAIALTVLVGFSRVYLGVHWPTDVLAGWAAGAVWALVCWGIIAWIGRFAASRHTPQGAAIAAELEAEPDVAVADDTRLR